MATIKFNNESSINVNLSSEKSLNTTVKDLNYIPEYKQYEKERQENEPIRETNENVRILNEIERQNNELVRQTNEEERKNNELTRQVNETNREEYINSFKADVIAGKFKGEKGDIGASNVLTIGTVSRGDEAQATITGISPSQILNLVLPKGDKGDKGESGEKGTTLYSELTDKPSINGVDLEGNQTAETLKLQPAGDYATKNYVEQEIAAFDFIKIVTKLPETGLSNRTYFVPKANTDTSDLYDEYMWVNEKWELIGTKQIEVDLADYVKNTDYATSSKVGVIKAGTSVAIDSSGKLDIAIASSSIIKNGTGTNRAIVPFNQHQAAFYGLAKASGDITQSSSSNAVGTYTDEAKTSIKKMLGISETSEVINSMAGNEADFSPSVNAVKEYVDKAIVSYGVYKDTGNLEFKTTSGFQGFDVPLNNVKYSKNLNDKFTLNSDGSITVGKGVNLIKISASFTLNRGQSGYIKTYITKNGSDNSVVIGGNTFTDYYPSQAPLTPVLLEVQEGDVLRLRFSTSADSGKTLICQQCNQTIYLTIEEV